MNLSELVDENVQNLVHDGSSSIHVQDMADLRRWVKVGYKVLDISKYGKYTRYGGRGFSYYIPYGKYGERYDLALQKQAMKDEEEIEVEFTDKMADQQKIAVQKGEDFVNEFEELFEDVTSAFIIILSDKEADLIGALTGILALEPLPKMNIAIYAAKEYDLGLLKKERKDK